MKIPFHTILGPPLRRNAKTLKTFCAHPFLGSSSAYAAILGIIGASLSLVDIIRVVRGGPVLPCGLWRTRIKSGRIVSAASERDLKLICLVLSAEYYGLLVFATFMKNPALFLPWLSLYAVVIILEFVNFVVRMFVDGLCFNKSSLFTSMFVIYNWLAMFCAFYRHTGGCDL